MAPMLSSAQKTGHSRSSRRRSRLIAFVSGVALALMLHFGAGVGVTATSTTTVPAASHATPQTFVVADGGGTGMPPCNC